MADSANPPASLIGPHDPPPCRVLNPDGKASLLLVCDHASNAIPRPLGNLGLDTAALQRHIAHDIGACRLFENLVERFDAPGIAAGYSRLVIDLNRSIEDQSLIPPVSDGTAIPGNQHLSESERNERIRTFFTPYRQAIDARLQSFRARGIVPAFIAIHSFTPRMVGGDARPWQVGVLWDKDPRIPVPLIRGLRMRPEEFQIGDNQPYSGKHPADYTIDHHAEAAGLPHVSIEVRQDLIDTELGAARWAGILHDALAEILDDPQLYRVWESV